jgi:hypothetical protein
VSAAGPRSPRRTVSGGNAAAATASGAWGLIKLAFAIFGLLVLGLGVWGYQRAHTPQFKLECAAYQAHVIPMSFPDNMLCLMFWSAS